MKLRYEHYNDYIIYNFNYKRSMDEWLIKNITILNLCFIAFSKNKNTRLNGMNFILRLYFHMNIVYKEMHILSLLIRNLDRTILGWNT